MRAYALCICAALLPVLGLGEVRAQVVLGGNPTARGGAVERPPLGGGDGLGDLCRPPTGTDCDGRIERMKLRYLGGSCEATTNLQGGYLTCDGESIQDDEVFVTVTGGPGTPTYWAGFVALGQEFLVTAADGGDEFLPKKTRIDVQNGAQVIVFQSNCSRPVNVGDVFASMQVTEITTTRGGTVMLDPAELGCSLTSAVADVDAGSLTLRGRICDQLGGESQGPRVFVGDGAELTQVSVLDAGEGYLVVELPIVDPQTAAVVLECPCATCVMDARIGVDHLLRDATSALCELYGLTGNTPPELCGE